MYSRSHTKMVHEGKYVAEVEVKLINTADDDWAPYLSLDDVIKLDTVREALKQGDIIMAKKYSKVYKLSEVAA